MRVSELSRFLVIMPGRFQPWHLGHFNAYSQLQQDFKSSPVFVATSNKVDLPDSPLSFSQKAYLIGLTGVPMERVIETEQPYSATEITSGFNPDSTVLVYAVSEKDMGVDPRFDFKPLKDGSPSYYQPFDRHTRMAGFNKSAYIYVMPTIEFSVLGQDITSASEIREMYRNSASDGRQKIIAALYGKFDKSAYDILNKEILNGER
jgi:hypothetical protein